MPFKGKQARGGKRKGAGRKPTAYTLLKRRVIAESLDEAEKSFDFYVQVRDNEDEPTSIRLAAADKILDRVLGKAKEQMILDDAGLTDTDRANRITALLERARQERARQVAQADSGDPGSTESSKVDN